jgi:hypothetical protein
MLPCAYESRLLYSVLRTVVQLISQGPGRCAWCFNLLFHLFVLFSLWVNTPGPLCNNSFVPPVRSTAGCSTAGCLGHDMMIPARSKRPHGPILWPIQSPHRPVPPQRWLGGKKGTLDRWELSSTSCNVFPSNPRISKCPDAIRDALPDRNEGSGVCAS